MKQKILSLLMLLFTAIVGTGSAWAEDTTIYGFSLATGTFETPSGNSVDATGGTMTLASGAIETKNELQGYKMDGKGKTALISLSSGSVFKEGDKITVGMFSASNPTTETSNGIDICNSSKASVKFLSEPMSAKKGLYTADYTVSKDDGIAGNSSFYLIRVSATASTYFQSVTVTRSESSEGDGDDDGEDSGEDSDPETPEGTITWLFQADKLKDGAAFEPKGLNYFVSEDGKYTITYKGNSDSDAIKSATPGSDYSSYLFLNGATGSSRYMSFTGIEGKGTLTFVFAGDGKNKTAVTINKDTYSGTAIASFNTEAANLDNTTVTTSKLRLSASSTYYINGVRTLYSIIWTPVVSDVQQPVTVTYYDTDGTTVIDNVDVEEGSALAYEYDAKDVTLAQGQAFRGWFNSAALTATKVEEGTAVNDYLSLYAHATDIEVAQAGTIYDWDLTKPYFYQEDHELISIEGKFHDAQHGWDLANGKKFSVEVGGNAIVNLTLCNYSAAADITVTDAAGNALGTIAAKADTDGSVTSFSYEGPATTLHFTVAGTTYIHGIKVYNINELPARNAAGYYVLQPGDAAGLILTLSVVKSGDVIFLPNGTYNLGTTVQTQVPAGVSLIGQSMEGVVIKNAPDFEQIGGTATLFLSGSDIYLQDLTLECYAPYDATSGAERGAALWDKGTKNMLKNVCLRGTQDTYYSNGAEGMLSYFEGGRIEGTTDFICGSGSILFNGVELYATNSKTYKGTGKTTGDVLVAPATYTSERGYVFLDCVVNGEASQNTTYNMARAWKNDAAVTFVGTKLNITPKATAVWGNNMSSFTGTRRFALYNSEPNTFDNADAAAMAQADATLANVLGGWDPTAQTAQATAEVDNIDPSGIYLIETVDGALLAIVSGSELNVSDYEGKLLRKANARGGFGEGVAIGELDEPEVPEIPVDLSSEKWSYLCAGKSKLVDAAWYGSKQAQRIADIVLDVQKTSGGWMKNDELHILTDAEYATLVAAKGEHSCLDNYATTQEVRYLAKVYQATGKEKYRAAILQALQMILDAKLTELGGWGQYWPLSADKWSYQNYITFNDDLTVNVLKLMRDVYEAKGDFTDLVDDATKALCKEVFDNGLELIIACQIDDNGTPAAWCAQHDPTDLLPTEGRPHELPSVSAYESAAIIDFLMTIDRPSAELQACITSAVAWLDAHKIEGKAVKNYTNAAGEDDIRVIDKEGSAIWGRFIQLGGESGAKVYNKFFDKLKARGKSRSCKDGHTYTEEEMARVSYDPEKAYEPIYSIYADSNPELFYRFLYNYEDTPAVTDEKGCQIATSLNTYRRTHYQYLGSWSQAVINAYPTWKEKMDLLNELGDAEMYELSQTTYDKSETIDGATVYSFDNGFSVSNMASKSYNKGNNNTIKYSIDVPYTISIPEGMQVTKVKFSGYDNYADVDAYLSSVNGTECEATDYVFPQKDASGNYFMTHTIDLSESPATGTLPFMIKGKQCCLIISLFVTNAEEKCIEDINGDGDVDIVDIVTYIIKMDQGTAPDLTNDGEMNQTDVKVIEQKILNPSENDKK